MKKLIVVTVLILFAGFTFSQSLPEEDMKTFIERYVEAVSSANLSQFEEFLSPEMKHHGPDNTILDIERWKFLVSANKQAYPDWKLTVDELIIKNDIAIARFTSTGTNTGKGSTNANPPTGKKITYSGVTIFYFVNGKIIEERVFYDSLPVLNQLGFTITPPEVQSD